MNSVIEQAKILRKSIDATPEAQEYYRLKSLYENDKELKKMRQDIARLKSEGKEEERNNLLKNYNSHPLVNNFQIAEEELKELLRTVQNIIQ